jgi:predicted nucleic acid-binding protein
LARVITLDASVLIAHLSPADLHNEAATAIVLGGTPGKMLVHTVTMAEVLVGGVRIGQGAAMLGDLWAAGIAVAPHDDGEPLRLAELRATTGLTLPDCCVLDIALHYQASLATFDDSLAAAARQRGVPLA